MLFTSGISVINRNRIVKIEYKKLQFVNVLKIKYLDFGRVKSRGIVLTKSEEDINSALKILLDEKLIDLKDINLYSGEIEGFSYILSTFIFGLILNSKFIFTETFQHLSSVFSEGLFLVAILSMIICQIIFIKIISKFYKRKKGFQINGDEKV